MSTEVNDLSTFVLPLTTRAVYCAENLDIHKGSYKGHIVAATVIRVLGPWIDRRPWDRTEKRFLQELVRWQKLRHPNITPIYGYCKSTFGPPTALSYISPWMQGGRVPEYLRHHPETDRMKLAVDVAQGLAYLHDNDLIHGELMGSNVLVNHVNGRALLCDYGLWNVLDDNRFEHTMGDRPCLRFAAVELCVGDVSNVTPITDVWSYGMTAYQLFSDKLPFSHILSSFRVPGHISRGNLPEHPGSLARERGLTDEVWEVIQSCWVTYTARPSSRSICESMQRLFETAGGAT